MQLALFVEERGPGEAPTIVLLHGGGLSGRMWEPQLERLPDWHCIVPDLPEQGRSAHVAPFTLDDAAERVAKLIRDRAPGGRAHIVGLSLGGAVALTVLRRNPELVRRAVVSGTAAGIGRTLGAVSKASAKMYRWFRPETVADMSLKQFGIPGKYRDVLQHDLVIGTRPEFIRHFTDALMTMVLPVGSAVPVLVAVGERETVVAKRSARRIAAALPGARAVLVPRAGHVWNLQHPDLFADTVRAWCTGSPLPETLRAL